MKSERGEREREREKKKVAQKDDFCWNEEIWEFVEERNRKNDLKM